MAYLESLPETAALRDVLMTHPAMATPLIAMIEEIMRGPGPFSGAEREAIAAYVSSLNGCAFCLGVHSKAAEAMGMDAETVGAICLRP
ncbi:MAG: carboxymuconolactone decarboxylase family protein [Pseudomonadota bacterium]